MTDQRKDPESQGQAEEGTPEEAGPKHLGKPGRRHRHWRRWLIVALAAAGVAAVIAVVTVPGGRELLERLSGFDPDAPTAEEAPAQGESSAVAAGNEGAGPEGSGDSDTSAGGDADAADAATEGETDDAAGSGTSAESADAEGATPERKVGDHDAPTAEDQVAMANLAESISVEGAPEGFAESAGYQELLYQAVVWQRSGYDLGFVLTDIASGANVSYNAQTIFYPASSIKAPYVCSLYQELVEKGGDQAAVDELASTTIENSDNDAFHALHRIYGSEPFREWVAEAGIEGNSEHDASYLSQHNYPFITATQLDEMWEAIYGYCTSGTEPSKTVADYLSKRTTSPIADAVGDRYASWGKAGWFYDTNFDCSPATVDAGVVFADKGPYRLVMMSDAPGALDAMAELAAGMDSAAAELAG